MHYSNSVSGNRVTSQYRPLPQQQRTQLPPLKLGASSSNGD